MGCRGLVYTIPRAISTGRGEFVARMEPIAREDGRKRPNRGLLQDLQIGDDIVDIPGLGDAAIGRSEEHTSELQSQR